MSNVLVRTCPYQTTLCWIRRRMKGSFAKCNASPRKECHCRNLYPYSQNTCREDGPHGQEREEPSGHSDISN